MGGKLEVNEIKWEGGREGILDNDDGSNSLDPPEAPFFSHAPSVLQSPSLLLLFQS